ncbi:MAG: VOC family protein [Candidatus Lokiarchaeota archaeon]|nr:VOC family protein [Candidatus Lokiarchaeota archaeon]
MSKIVHFEINTENPLRAKSFYEDVFDWKIEKWEGPMEYWMIEAGKEDEEGINGGLQKREEPDDQVFNYIQVSKVDDFKNKIEQYGGTIESPKIAVPGVGYFYMFKDTEGNKLGIMEEDENAK